VAIEVAEISHNKIARVRTKRTFGDYIDFSLEAVRNESLEMDKIKQTFWLFEAHENVDIAVLLLFATRKRTEQAGICHIILSKDIVDFRQCSHEYA
jgi:hypothetical protein